MSSTPDAAPAGTRWASPWAAGSPTSSGAGCGRTSCSGNSCCRSRRRRRRRRRSSPPSRPPTGRGTRATGTSWWAPPTAAGSRSSTKEILPFIPKEGDGHGREEEEEPDGDCSDVLIVSDSTAIAAHNEDGNVALLGHTYLVRATLPDGLSFTAYTCAGELPSCAFGFNSNGVAFTLDSVPPVNDEIVAGAIARNFVSRDLLEAKNLEDAMRRICSPGVSVGHSYNLMDVRGRRIVNVETASGNRFAVHEAGATPFFHANMYRHLQVKQVQDENSMSREKRAAQCSVDSKETALSLLGDTADDKYPIYMTGPTLHTLCTVLVDLDKETMTIYKGNPKNGEMTLILPML
ncbi:hypothetical protein PVAP13_5KG022200 [Panicum virgatum]|uniref:Peptidase C45 hydrolase domain-containing protein n=1 Tax=Panicum virgatum TaxID=38727 RepID=A0A8T0S878_PANVG|nr:hypothetical protein PVAP13_5KG022200 [Panicum virgatum]